MSRKAPIITRVRYLDMPKNYFADPVSEFMSFGEWFCRDYFKKGFTDPEIFYCTSMIECGKLIEQKYVLKEENDIV